jgi:hypothetical protein
MFELELTNLLMCYYSVRAIDKVLIMLLVHSVFLREEGLNSINDAGDFLSYIFLLNTKYVYLIDGS